MYTILYGLGLLGGRTTRASTGGDCAVPHRYTAFSKQVLLVSGSEVFHEILAPIRNYYAFHNFKIKLKSKVFMHVLSVLCSFVHFIILLIFVVFFFHLLVFVIVLLFLLTCQELQMETRPWLILAYLHVLVHSYALLLLNDKKSNSEGACVQ